MNRRHLFGLAASAAGLALQSRAAAAGSRSPEEIAADEDFWAPVRASFTIDRNWINFNNGYCSPSPRPVQDAFRRQLDYTDIGPYHTMVATLERQVEAVRRRLARYVGCDPEELAITRNASEALENAQYGIDLKPGDEVITTNQDYPRMITTYAQRERREGIVLKQLSFPVPPPSMDDLYQRFERAITPRTKILHFCHITNRTGQIFPVQRICRMARQRGITTIVDGAHAVSHFPFKLSDLECDFYGTSLHKWTYAPIGTGFLYVRKDRIASTWSMMASDKSQANDIRKFEEIGTHPAANHNAIAEAVVYNENLGIDRKAARLRYLRDRWAARLAKHPKCKILHSPDPAQSCGLGFLAFAPGIDGAKMREVLYNKYSLITTYMGHDEYSGLRISPNIYTTLGEVDVFADAIERELA